MGQSSSPGDDRDPAVTSLAQCGSVGGVRAWTVPRLLSLVIPLLSGACGNDGTVHTGSTLVDPAPRGPAAGDGSGGTAIDSGDGSAGAPPVPDTSPCADPNPCVYPQSLGGGPAPDECGATKGAWSTLGGPERATWPSRTQWASAGGDGVSGPNAVVAYAPAVAFSADGSPVVAWIERDKIRVRRWDGSEWLEHELGALGEAEYQNNVRLEIAVDGNDNLLLADYHDNQIQVLRGNGAAWEVLGQWEFERYDFRMIRMALDAEDQPTLVWLDQGNVYLRRYDGTAWAGLGASAEGGGISDSEAQAVNLALAFGKSGAPIVAWTERLDSTSNIPWVARWDGDEWQRLDGPTPEYGVADAPISRRQELRLAENESLIVAWPDQYRVWDGTGWSEVQAIPGGDLLELASNKSGATYLLSRDGEADHMSRWNGGGWDPLDPGPLRPSCANGWCNREALAVSSDEQLALAWSSGPQLTSQTGAMFMLTHNGDQWAELGEATGTGQGLSRGSEPRLLKTETGRLTLLSDCRLQEWDGSQWNAVPLPEEATYAEQCNAAFDSQDRLVLAFWEYNLNRDEPDDSEEPDDDPPTSSFYAFRKTTDGWEPVGGRANQVVDDYYPSAPALAFDSHDNPWLAWLTVPIYDESAFAVMFSAYDGSEWTWLGGMYTAALRGSIVDWEALLRRGLRLAATRDERPSIVLATETAEFDPDVVQLRGVEWTGEAWAETLPEHDIVLPVGHAPTVQLLEADASHPVLVWSDTDDLHAWQTTDGVWEPAPSTEEVLATLPERARWRTRIEAGEVYVEGYSDCGWEGLSASNYGGGVSNSSATGKNPSLLVEQERVCVAWSEFATRNDQLFLRCHER